MRCGNPPNAGVTTLRQPALLLKRLLTARRLTVVLLLAAVWLLASPPPATAQTESTPAYWRYDAPGRIEHLAVADLDGDGFDEFVLATQNNEIVAVNGDGSLQWQLRTGEPILALTPVYNRAQASYSVAFVTARQIVFLNSSGAILNSVTVAFTSTPLEIVALDVNDDQIDEVAVSLAQGMLAVYSQGGNLLWESVGNSDPTVDANPQIAIVKTEPTGATAVAFGYFGDERFSRLRLIDAQGRQIWQRAVEGRITALTVAAFAGEPTTLALGTSRGRVETFGLNGQSGWFRTLNKPIDEIAFGRITTAQDALFVGTDVGQLVAYSATGRRLWDRKFSNAPSQRIAAIAAQPAALTTPQSTTLVVSLQERETTESGVVDLYLLDSSSRTIDQYRTRSVPGLAQPVDTNGDGLHELAFVQFGTLELLAAPTNSRKSLEDWDNPYRLNANPTAVLSADIDLDSQDDVIIGTRSGQLHRVQTNGNVTWVQLIAGDIVSLAALPAGNPQATTLLIAYNASVGESAEPQPIAYVQARRSDGREVWQSNPLSGQITSMTLFRNVVDDPDPLAIVATSTNLLSAYDMDGTLRWQRNLLSPIGHVTTIERDGRRLVAVGTDRRISLFEENGEERFTLYLGQLNNFLRNAPAGAANICESPTEALFLLDSSALVNSFCYGKRLSELEELIGRPVQPPMQVGDFLFVVLNETSLRRLSINDSGQGLLIDDQLNNVSSFFADDLTGDGLTDLMVGDGNGTVSLYTGQGTTPSPLLQLSSRVFHLSTIRAAPFLEPSLLVVTENGLVRLYSSQPNYAPLLVDASVESIAGQFNLSVSVFDVENDQVTVNLDTWSDSELAWQPIEQRTVNGQGVLFWAVPPTSPDAAPRYRFAYSDGTHQGAIELQSEPPALPSPSRFLNWALPTGVLLAFFALGIVYLRQTRSLNFKAQRFYRTLKEEAYAQSLPQIEAKFNEVEGDAQFLLNFASSARQDGNRLLASIGDGLYLLTDRPDVSISILLSTLETVVERRIRWDDRDFWLRRFKIVNSLMQAPTLTDLALRRSELVGLMDQLKAEERCTSATLEQFESLVKIMDSLRDSERVDSGDDRFFYLNEAAALLRQLARALEPLPISLNLALVRALQQRWQGVTTAALESLRGRARLDVSLKTKRIAPSAETTIVLELTNTGRAPAEQVTVTLQEDPTYVVHAPVQAIPILTPGRKQTLSFPLSPPEADQFRVSFSITYDDRQRQRKTFAYANQVNVLTPPRDFRPITNPYAPGTPLRQNSALFYGREDLFDFISEEASRLAQQKVLILVGQRRTGKTSALLRLGQYLPPTLLPVYIDCQSLGVLPGMTAFFQDLAWVLSETLEARGHDVSVPELETIHDNPAHWFQKEFLPRVRACLPAETTLLLVFDEFEAFENLVNDDILPRTLFTYLRYLMQHGEGLSFVFTGTRRLEEMTTDYWSVLFNIALYKRVDFLSQDAAIRLITEPVAPNLVYDDLALDKLLRITAGHPYFLQLVCYTLVKRANASRTNYITISDVNTAVSEMLRLGEVHFAYLWERSTKTERIFLTAVGHLLDKEYPFRPVDLVQSLLPYGIRLKPEEVTSALNRLVERDIMQEVFADGALMYELKIGLVGLWVEQNKSLSRLYDNVLAINK